MTIQDLIDRLSTMEDKNMEIVIPIDRDRDETIVYGYPNHFSIRSIDLNRWEDYNDGVKTNPNAKRLFLGNM